MPSNADRSDRGQRASAGSYLTVRHWRRHLHYSDRRAKWIKAYVSGDDDGRRGLDDEILTGLPVATRLLLELMLKLAARFDNMIPYDVRRIAGWLTLRPQEVAKALQRLLDEGYLELIENVKVAVDGSLQLPLASDSEAATEAAEEPHTPRTHAADTPSHMPQTPHHSIVTPGEDSAQPGRNGADPASDLLGLTRAGARAAEQDRDREGTSSKATALRDSGDALPDDSRTSEITRRTIGLVARGDERSAAIIRATSAGLPDHVLAQALESYLGRRPRPRNPGGYIVQTIRSIAAEAGYTVERATIDREPDL